MSSVTPHEKGGQAEKKTSTGRGTQLFKEQAQPIFGPTPELLLNFTRYLKSAKMKRYMERAKGVSLENQQKFLHAHVEERIGKELTNFRGKAYRVLCLYPDIKEIDVVPLWNTILTRTDFELGITADSPAILEALKQIDESCYSRIKVGVTIATDSGGTWNAESLSVLSQLQVRGLSAFPKFTPHGAPKDWENSLQKAIARFDPEKCDQIWAGTAFLVASNKKGVASPKELDVGKDVLAQGFYAALKKIADDKLQFQHHPPRRFQAAWERRLLGVKATDSFGLLLNYLPVPEASEEKALKDLHDKIVHEDASKIESYTAMYDIYQMTLADAKGDEKAATRRFVRLCEVVWNRSRTQASRNLAAGKFVHQLKEAGGGLPLPEKEYHVRCLCKLPEEQRITCWKEIHQEIIRFPEDKKSISERVKRYARDKGISRSKTEPSPESKLLAHVKRLSKAALQLFGGESEIANLCEQLQELLRAKVDSSRTAAEPMAVKESTPTPEQHQKELTVQEQALVPNPASKPKASVEPGPAAPDGEIIVDQTVPIGTKKALQGQSQLSEELPMPVQVESPATQPEANHLLALALEQAPSPIEQDSLPEPELLQQEIDPTPSGEGADATG